MSGFSIVLWSINAVTIVSSGVAIWYAVQAHRSSRRVRELLR